MAEAEQALIDLLKADASVAAIVGTRIYFTQAPQTPVLPYAVMFRVDGPRVYGMEGASGLVAARVQIDIYSKTAKQARDVGRTIRQVLSGFRGEQSGVNLQAVLLLDEGDGYEDSPELQRVTHDYRVWYQEE